MSIFATRNFSLSSLKGAKNDKPIHRITDLRLNAENCEVDGRTFSVKAGMWAFYVPKLRLKLLHAVDGQQHCTTTSAPSRQFVLSGQSFPTRPEYTPADWQAAYSKPIAQRVAENIVCAERLAKAKIGPAVRGYCVVRTFRPWFAEPTITAGYVVQNIYHKLPKRQTTLEELTRAGVEPDRINSCLRQQIRGYVSDLNSVIGVMPKDADEEVAEIRLKLEQAFASF